MRCPRWLAPVLLLTLLVSVGSVNAASGPALTDRGRSVVYVDGRDKDIPNLLPAAEVEKLITLTQGEVFTQLISTVSPDDQGILVVEGENLGFLNIQTGGFVPVDVSAFDRIFPVALQGIGGWAWRDGRTLTSIGVELVDPREFIVRVVLVTLDRVTGTVRSIPLPDFPENDFPISLSPNAGRLLLVRSEFTDEPAEVVTARVTYPTIKSRIDGGLPTRVRNQFATWKSKSPLVQKLLQYRPLLDTEGESISVIRQELTLLVYDTASGETSELKKLAAGTDLLSFAWSQDGARLAASFSGIFDYLEDVNAPRRPFFDGALLSEQIYRDATGNLDPKDNPFFQSNSIETYDFGTGETHELRAAAGDGALLAGVSWSTDGKTLAALAMDPARLAGRRFPIYTLQFSQRTTVRFYNFDLTPVRRLERPELAGSVFTTDVRFASPDELIIRAPVGNNYL
ncbi:MAG: hypothetical protein MUD01_12865 [Chloroflexaceae bacterium]|nr:hypothetical protein [Chloroflexaceae bacterium]